MEFAEPANPALQVVQNGRFPFSADDVGGDGDGAIERIHFGIGPDTRYQ